MLSLVSMSHTETGRQSFLQPCPTKGREGPGSEFSLQMKYSTKLYRHFFKNPVNPGGIHHSLNRV